MLRDLGADFALFLNATSPKWRELCAEPRCQVALWYPTLQRQWRLRATVESLGHEVLASHWKRRPRSAQVMDHAYARFPQSSELTDAAELAAAHAELDRTLGAQPEPPDAARAVRLVFTSAECLQIHAADRLHERWLYRGEAGGWKRTARVP